ncbi:MAG: TetR/AcrR family transcriptional regulator [Bacteroidetes bacterium]|nr:TetR/AcrR family transcriptional regulator [Bacteroidota bacterium]
MVEKIDKRHTGTEKIILDAARHVFIRKGFDGARMQEIANEANINKALLHYYFRNKDKLFMAIFVEVIQSFILSTVKLIRNPGHSVFDKIRLFVEKYISFIQGNPYLPGFILNELNRRPDRLVGIFKSSGLELDYFYSQIEKEIREGKIEPVEPEHLLINMISMCIFPFVGKPMINTIILSNSEKDFNLFMEERKRTIPEFIINSIKKQKK